MCLGNPKALFFNLEGVESQGTVQAEATPLMAYGHQFGITQMLPLLVA